MQKGTEMDDSRWLAVLTSGDYLTLAAGYTAFMTLLWGLRRPLGNAGLVDLGWPVGLVAIATYFYFTGDGWAPRRAVLCGMFALCGLRFIVGWFVRNIRYGEDRRWDYWRRLWSEQGGPFGLRSEDANFLIFYHAQTVCTLLVMASALALAAYDPRPEFHRLEVLAVGLWVASFALENVADVQLDRFRKSAAGNAGVCRVGLWAYSRHPNYFFEFMLWVAYAVFAWPSAVGWLDYVALVTVPVFAYWFLVHHTGIPLTEQASLERRGEVYRQYQNEVSRFFPWPPRKS